MPTRALRTIWSEGGPRGVTRKLSAVARMSAPLMLRGRRTAAGVGAYFDLDVRLFKKLHISGGPRADLLLVNVNDHLAGLVPAGSTPGVLAGAAVRGVEGIAAGPRATVSYDITRTIAPVVSYGEGFRSLDVQNLTEGAAPYSKIRSVEAGFRAQSPGERFTTSFAPASFMTTRQSMRCGASFFRGSIKMASRTRNEHTGKKYAADRNQCQVLRAMAQARRRPCSSRASAAADAVTGCSLSTFIPSHRARQAALPAIPLRA